MAVEFISQDGERIIFWPVIRRKYRGLLLPGSNVCQTGSDSLVITLQDFEYPLFAISHRIFDLFNKVKISITERPGLRLEALLAGEMKVIARDSEIKLRAGQYHLTDVPIFATLFKQNTSCSLFITYYSAELLEQLGVNAATSPPTRMSEEMSTLIQQLFHSRYEESLRNFHYENMVRELLFFHLAQKKGSVASQLENSDIAAVYRADEIIASNINEHFTIEELSRMAGTNRFKLTRGFQQIFGMGVFHRLLYRRMEHAKSLLETTNKSIGEIARLAGYDTAAAFIHAFRKKFDLTPREWRNNSREVDEE